MAVERAAAAARGNGGGEGGSAGESAARVRQLEGALEAARAEADAREAAAVEERDNAVRCVWLPIAVELSYSPLCLTSYVSQDA